MGDFQTFLVPFDFSEHSRAALAVAKQLAKRLNADLYLLHAVQPLIYAGAYGAAVPPQIDMVELRDAAKRSLEEVAAGCRDIPGKVTAHVLESGNIAETVRETAEELDADLVVMGTHGRTGLAHVFLGSVAERTLRKAPCPVLTVRGDEERSS